MLFRLLTMLSCAGFLGFGAVSFAQDTTDTLAVEPEAYGIDSAVLAEMFDYIGTELRIDGIMIVRHGETILEAYRHPFRADLPHVVNSVTKTFAGALTGIAIHEGIIESVDTPMLDFFTEASNPDQEAITVEHLVAMTAGIEWAELTVPYGSTANSFSQFERAENPVNAFLNLEVVDEPGTRFNYCSGCMDMLTAIIEASTDESALRQGNRIKLE